MLLMQHNKRATVKFSQNDRTERQLQLNCSEPAVRPLDGTYAPLPTSSPPLALLCLLNLPFPIFVHCLSLLLTLIVHLLLPLFLLVKRKRRRRERGEEGGARGGGRGARGGAGGGGGLMDKDEEGKRKQRRARGRRGEVGRGA